MWRIGGFGPMLGQPFAGEIAYARSELQRMCKNVHKNMYIFVILS